MAQFGRALRSGRRGRWFKSSQPDQSMRRDRFLRSLFLAIVVIPRHPRYTHSSLSRCIVEVYMFGLRAPELIIILVVVLIIFGPKNLPKLGKSLGSTVKNIREGMEGNQAGRGRCGRGVQGGQGDRRARGQARCCQEKAGRGQRRGRRVVPSLWGEHLTGLPAG